MASADHPVLQEWRRAMAWARELLGQPAHELVAPDYHVALVTLADRLVADVRRWRPDAAAANQAFMRNLMERINAAEKERKKREHAAKALRKLRRQQTKGPDDD